MFSTSVRTTIDNVGQIINKVLRDGGKCNIKIINNDGDVVWNKSINDKIPQDISNRQAYRYMYSNGYRTITIYII